MPKQHFYIRLIPPRSTFASDMTPDERAIMQQHVTYFTDLFQKGNILIFGPVRDPAGAFGMGVFEVDDQSTVQAFLENDPSVRSGLNQFQIIPMIVGAARAKSPSGPSAPSR